MFQMKEEYHVGDRVQKTGRLSESDRIHPGERGYVSRVSSYGGIAVCWDRSWEYGAPDTRLIRPIPALEEFKLLNSESCTRLEDAQPAWDSHLGEVSQLLSAMENYAESSGCLWVVKRSFLDDAHKSHSTRFELVEGTSLSELIDGCSTKNGIDIGFSSKRAANARSMMLIAYGQNYDSPTFGSGTETELIECRLINKPASDRYRDMINSGMSTHGKHFAEEYFSTHLHAPLAQCIHDCRAITKGKCRNHEAER